MTKKFKSVLPASSSRRFSVVLTIFDQGPMTIDQFFCLDEKWFTFRSKWALRKELGQMRHRGCLQSLAATSEYALTDAARDELRGVEIKKAQEGPKTPPPYRPKTGPLQLKHLPSLQARRNDAGPVPTVRGYLTSGTSASPFLDERY